MARVLRDIFRAVIVKPGRGKLDERVTVVPHEHLGDALVNHLRRKLPGAVVQGADAVLSGSPLDQILAEDAAGVGEPKP